jgi:hypothetical protein
MESVLYAHTMYVYIIIYLLDDIFAGEILVPVDIIRPVDSASALTWFI